MIQTTYAGFTPTWVVWTSLALIILIIVVARMIIKNK